MIAFLSLGSNIGNRQDWLRFGVAKLAGLLSVSSVYETEPMGGPVQDSYLNIVVCIETHLEPLQLLERCHAIEKEALRDRAVRNGPRTLDIDILTYGDLQLDEENLSIPHPRMCERNFVRVPLLELCPDFDFSHCRDGHAKGEVVKVGPL